MIDDVCGLVCFSFPSVKISCGGLAHFWCPVFIGHLDVGHHITTAKVSISLIKTKLKEMNRCRKHVLAV